MMSATLLSGVTLNIPPNREGGVQIRCRRRTLGSDTRDRLYRGESVAKRKKAQVARKPSKAKKKAA